MMAHIYTCHVSPQIKMAGNDSIAIHFPMGDTSVLQSTKHLTIKRHFLSVHDQYERIWI